MTSMCYQELTHGKGQGHAPTARVPEQDRPMKGHGTLRQSPAAQVCFDSQGEPGWSFVPALIDDVRIYNRASRP